MYAHQDTEEAVKIGAGGMAGCFAKLDLVIMRGKDGLYECKPYYLRNFSNLFAKATDISSQILKIFSQELKGGLIPLY